jgi:hypothetical protein
MIGDTPADSSGRERELRKIIEPMLEYPPDVYMGVMNHDLNVSLQNVSILNII